MNRLTAALSSHRKELMIAGAGLVAALGLYQHQKSKSAPAGDGSQAIGPDGASIAGYAPSGATGGAAYDSTGNDVYNALQPQLEQNQTLLAQLLERLNGGGASTSTPAPPTAPAPVTSTPTPPHIWRPVAPPPRTTPRPAPKPKAPTRTYLVRRGDSLTKIALRLNVGSWQKLYAQNKSIIGPNPDLIVPGQRLVIPG